MSIKHLFFDMDDTLVQTDQYIKRKILTGLTLDGATELLKVFNGWLLLNKTTLELPECLKEASFKYGLSSGEFMLNKEKSPLISNLPAFRLLLRRVTDLGIHTGIVTHRGWHEDGLKNTQAWLVEKDLHLYFDDVIVLDAKENPSKTDYLEKHFTDFKIVDDNPLHDLGKVYPKDDRLLIYTGIGNYDAYRNQCCVDNLIQIWDAVLNAHHG